MKYNVLNIFKYIFLALFNFLVAFISHYIYTIYQNFVVAYILGAISITLSMALYSFMNNTIKSIKEIDHIKQYTNSKYFTWKDDVADGDFLKNSVCISYAIGRSKAAQRFVEALSYKIGYKCDFTVSMGRIILRVYKCQDAIEKANEALCDDEWMKQFIVPFSEENFDNETYFEIAR